MDSLNSFLNEKLGTEFSLTEKTGAIKSGKIYDINSPTSSVSFLLEEDTSKTYFKNIYFISCNDEDLKASIISFFTSIKNNNPQKINILDGTSIPLRNLDFPL